MWPPIAARGDGGCWGWAVGKGSTPVDDWFMPVPATRPAEWLLFFTDARVLAASCWRPSRSRYIDGAGDWLAVMALSPAVAIGLGPTAEAAVRPPKDGRAARIPAVTRR